METNLDQVVDNSVQEEECSAAVVGTILTVKHFRNGEEVEDSRRKVLNKCVTDAGVNALMNTTTPKGITAFNYHDSGTGVTAESAPQTVLVTPSGVARVSGTQSNPSANKYRSVATIAYTSSLAITEHGIFDAVSSGTLLDRTLFSAINVVSGDSIQFTFEFTMASGG